MPYFSYLCSGNLSYRDMKDKVLNLPMRKCYAEQILSGKKVREFREFTDHWAERLCEFKDPEDPLLVTGEKHYDRAHFYPYNKSWWLDVEITDIYLCKVNQDFMEDFESEVNAKIGDDIFILRRHW